MLINILKYRKFSFLVFSLVLVVSFLYSATISLNIETALLAFIAFIFILIICSSFLIFNRKNNYLNLVFFTLCGYFILSYLFKSIVILEEYSLIKNLISLNQQIVNSYLMDALIISSFYIFGLFAIPALIYHSKFSTKFNYNYNDNECGELKLVLRFKVAFLICLLLLLFKFWVHHYLSLGVPGIEASGIPVIGGIITYLVRMGTFALVNILLFFSLKSNDIFKIYIGFVICCFFCLIDLSIGVKYSIVYQLYMFFILIYMTRGVSSVIKKNLNRVVVLISVFFLLIYSYINYYRFALLNGEVGFDAILTALGDEKAKSSNAMLDILNRVAGIENLIFSLVHKNNLNASIGNMFNSDFSVAFTESITGVSGAINAVGATQVGLLSIIFKENYFLIFIASAFLSVFLILILNLIIKAYGQGLHLLSFSIGAIFITYILFGTGNLLFYIKELFVMLVAVKFFLFLSLDKRYRSNV